MEALQLVNKEQFDKLQQLGFDWETRNSLPEVALAIKWLAVVKSVYLHQELHYHNKKNDWHIIMHMHYYEPFEYNGVTYPETLYYGAAIETYEEAESTALDFGLDYLIKKQQ